MPRRTPSARLCSLLLGVTLSLGCLHWLPSVQSRVVDEQGGVVTSADGTIRLTIPPQALSGPERITIRHIEIAPGTVDAEGDLVLAEVDLGPDGLQLQEPVLLEMSSPIPEANLEGGEFGWTRIVGEDGNEVAPTSSRHDLASGLLHAQTTLSHFSRYSKRYQRRSRFRFVLETPDWKPVGDAFDATARIEKDAGAPVRVDDATALARPRNDIVVGPEVKDTKPMPRAGATTVEATARMTCVKVGAGQVGGAYVLQGITAWRRNGTRVRLRDHAAIIDAPTLCHAPEASAVNTTGGTTTVNTLDVTPGTRVVVVDDVGSVQLAAGIAPAPAQFPDNLLIDIEPRSVLGPVDPDDYMYLGDTLWTGITPAGGTGSATRTFEFRCKKVGKALVVFSWNEMKASALFFCTYPLQEREIEDILEGE